MDPLFTSLDKDLLEIQKGLDVFDLSDSTTRTITSRLPPSTATRPNNTSVVAAGKPLYFALVWAIIEPQSMA